MIPQNILDRVQKLINLKEGAEAVGSLAEAENAAARLQDLVMKYNLDLEEVKKSQIEKRAEMFDEWVDLSSKQDKKESFWVPKLYAAIARSNFCKVFPNQRGIWIIGEKHNAELVLYISEQMISKVRIAAKLAWKKYEQENKDNWQAEKRGTFIRGFLAGACSGIEQKLYREKQEMSQEGNPYAVMIVNRDKVVQDYFYEKYTKPVQEAQEKMRELEKEQGANGKKKKEKKIKLRKGPRKIGSNDGWRSGYDAGLEMNINKGLDNSQPSGHIN